MKKFYVHTGFHGTKAVYAHNVCEAAFKVRQKLPNYDDVDSVEYYDARLKAYMHYTRGEDFEEWTSDDYEAWLYE